VTRDYVTNKNGVEGYWSHCGTHFGERQPDGNYKTAIPLFVPRCCDECVHLDRGEFGDYGSLLSGPYCMQNVWFPTKSGKCGKQEAL
jgi:hypothetical protein